MPRLTKIYTRTGDDGKTFLGSKERVPKDALRVSAYGDVDELNSLLGVARAAGLSSKLDQSISTIQNELFHLGSDLAFPDDDTTGIQVPRIEDRHVEKLEGIIDELLAVVGPLENFILPGGSLGAAQLQVARAVCRRSERIVVKLAREESINVNILKYLNRLSDLLFTMARFENHHQGIDEVLWNTLA
jgi:cob(I)alamin adenosyltransferase